MCGCVTVLMVGSGGRIRRRFTKTTRHRGSNVGPSERESATTRAGVGDVTSEQLMY